MGWRRHSVRRGLADEDGPFEGVPPHLGSALRDLLRDHASHGYEGSDEGFLTRLRLRFRLAGSAGQTYTDQLRTIFGWANSDADNMLDLVDWTLYDTAQNRSYTYAGELADAFEQVLDAGASIYTVSNGSGLTERVTPSAQKLVSDATAHGDTASAELSEAWKKAYGLHPDPSDAWDHSIKALEAVLKPIVTPNNHAATLGNVIGDVRADPTRLNFGMADNAISPRSDPAATLLGNLCLVWPNPDRHQGTQSREPSLAEARSVVHLAVTLVQWVRTGVLG